jgi:hypothetical protein
MFVKQTLSLFAFLAGGSLLLAGCDATQDPWKEYTGSISIPESEGKNTFYHRTSGDRTCFVGRMSYKSLSGTYAGHYNPETAKLHMYGHFPPLRMLVGSAEIEATEVKVASINQPQNPGELATLLLAENSPVDDKLSENTTPTSISNVFTEHHCWNGDKGLPKSLARTLKEKF